MSAVPWDGLKVAQMALLKAVRLAGWTADLRAD